MRSMELVIFFVGVYKMKCDTNNDILSSSFLHSQIIMKFMFLTLVDILHYFFFMYVLI